MVFREIERELQNKCLKEPMSLRDKLDYGNDTITSPQLEKVKGLFQNRTYNRGASDRKRLQQKFIYATIRGGVYNKRIAKDFGVTVSDVEETYNQYTHYCNFLRNCPEYEAFKGHLYELAKVAYDEECEKADSFESEGNLLDKLLLTGAPYLWIHRQLHGSNVKVKDGKSHLQRLDCDLNSGVIEQTDYNKQKNDVMSSIRMEEARIKHLLKALDGTRSASEKKNKFLIDFIGIDKILNSSSQQFKTLYIGSFTTAKELVRRFCSWHNKVYKSEIADNKAELRKKKQQENYQTKNAAKRAEKLKESIDFQTEVLELMSEGKSRRQIAKLTKKGYGTVLRAFDAIKSLVAQQADPKNSPAF